MSSSKLSTLWQGLSAVSRWGCSTAGTALNGTDMVLAADDLAENWAGLSHGEIALKAGTIAQGGLYIASFATKRALPPALAVDGVLKLHEGKQELKAALSEPHKDPEKISSAYGNIASGSFMLATGVATAGLLVAGGITLGGALAVTGLASLAAFGLYYGVKSLAKPFVSGEPETKPAAPVAYNRLTPSGQVSENHVTSAPAIVTAKASKPEKAPARLAAGMNFALSNPVF